MKQQIYVASICLVLLFTAANVTADSGDVAAKLSAFLVVHPTNGKESLRPGDRAEPGDTVEYRAIYSNSGKSTARNVEATLPIPAGTTVYLHDSARPAAALASTDGHTFEPMPLKRIVTLVNGAHETRLVPLSEYRYLRWQLGDLAAGKSTVVSARVQVLGTEVPQ
ncbi:MAG: DUF11 domain-containing protein [Gammaproteobacteria bacterium]|nr:DUF11 domain-containing protein [Gammaproteobacteria bacterium]